ncbi:melanoma-associated antigen B17-like [Lemur catta]|uniref:melanoma-associated antigen B17-like n=1 Tax=Lemur catta TaxID=9447 RepID=UPI001E268370|nr:melanoma-associated antigen B17-like [Lemur catta]
MPRGHESKLRAREKRRQARGECQGLGAAEAVAAGGEEAPSCSSVVIEGASQSAPAAGIPPKAGRARATRSSASAVSGTRAERGARGQEGECPSSSGGPSSREVPQATSMGKLVQFLLQKYRMKEPIMKAEMLKIVTKKYRKHFPEILQKATLRMELVFGLYLKEVGTRGRSYELVSKLDLSSDSGLSEDGFPKNGILMPLLSVIFMKGDLAPEEEMWEFLNVLGLYDGREHFIFGEPRKLITKDLVQEKYLEYRVVPNSDPPCYEFLWGSKAHAETSMRKVLEFMADIIETRPSTFRSWYEEGWEVEEERSQTGVAARAGATAQASAPCRGQIWEFTPALEKSEIAFILKLKRAVRLLATTV